MNSLKRKGVPKLPSRSTEDPLKAFSDFFVQKIGKKIRQVILESIPLNQDQTYAPQHQLLSTQETFNHVTQEVVAKIFRALISTSCPLDALPLMLLKKCLVVPLPRITPMFHCQFPRSFSHALVKPLLKKQSADSEVLENYRLNQT